MIKVKRLDCPDILKISETHTSDGEEETLDAINFFSNPANQQSSYLKTGKQGRVTKDSFTVYKDRAIRKQLKKMFCGKCAYCESRVVSTYSGDIEHFRPKGGYGDSNPLMLPGYYWLASDWDNLLFACAFCNQTSTHEINENGIISEVVLGKLNQFPLLSEQYRLDSSHGQLFFVNNPLYKIYYDLEETERLLLKPCTDPVEKYFKYEDNGVICPSGNLSNFEKQQAKTSIFVYALQRIDLVHAREQKVIQIKAQINRVEEALLNFNNYYDSSQEERGWFEGILTKELKILKKYKEPDQEYAGLAKYIIDDYIDNLMAVV